MREYVPKYKHAHKNTNISTTVHIITRLLRNVRACIVVAVWIGIHVYVCLCERA